VSIPDLLHQLLTAPAPSGSEERATAVWRAAAAPFAEVSGDTLGSSFARVPGQAGGLVCALVGHIDEIGVIATHVDERGFVSIRRIGGFVAEPLVGQRVEFLTGVKGLVARRRDTSTPQSDRKRADVKDLHVDIGARDADEARSLVRPGDAAVLSAQPTELPNGRIVSRSLDNRLGAYVALEAARRVAETGGARGDVVAVAAVQEEVGDYGGARTTVFALDPQVVLAVDITGATDIPDGDPKLDGEAKLGAGPIVNRGSTISPKVFDLLVETAEAEGIAYAVNVSAGDTHTDMDAAYASRGGTATGLISIPTRYIHTPTEAAALEDVDAAIRLVAAFARRLGPELDFTR
jgi:putative aminopeptidase FrvX